MTGIIMFLKKQKPGALGAPVYAFSSFFMVACFGPQANAGKVYLNGLSNAEYVDQFIVKYSDAPLTKVNVQARQKIIEGAADGVIRKRGGLAKGVRLRLAQKRELAFGADVIKSNRTLDRSDAAAVMQEIASDPNVEYVEVDAIVQLTKTPNDPRYIDQWNLQDSRSGIRANAAWDTTEGDGVVVAVLDTGTTNHSDLNGNVLPGYNFVDASSSRDGRGRGPGASDPGDWTEQGSCPSPVGVKDSSWHGTHVMGIVAALTNNGIGIAGTAPRAKVLPVRVSGGCGINTSDYTDAIIWAAGGSVTGSKGMVPANPTPASVISMSFGAFTGCGPTSQNAVNFALSRGVILVAGAGNNGMDMGGSSPSRSFAPASCQGVIAVASTGIRGYASYFSNYGSRVDISAPGEAIWSTFNSGKKGPGAETYTQMDGTSMATPHVAGVAALMKAVAPGLTPEEIGDLLKVSAQPFPYAPSQQMGAGVLDAKAAIDASIAYYQDKLARAAAQRAKARRMVPIVQLILQD